MVVSSIKARFVLAIFLSGYCLHAVAQLSIAEVNNLPAGSVVSTTGTMTTGDEFGQLKYMQDDEAGIALYSSVLDGVQPGDSIIVSGVLSVYRGQLQISPVNSFQIIASGKITHALQVDDLSEIADPQFASRKINLPCIGIQSCENTLTDGWYTIFDPTGNKARLLVDPSTPLDDYPITTHPITLSGIWATFEDQYQLLGQNIADASEGACHIIAPAEINFVGHKTQFSWSDLPAGVTTLWIGEEEFTRSLDFGMWSGPLAVIPPALPQGMIYKVRIEQIDDEGQHYFSPSVHFMEPSSPATPIEILFNRSVNADFSDGSAPIATGSSAIETDIIARIDQVQSTLDIAMYNTTRNAIVQAITRAAQRGVSVRYLAEETTSNSAIDGALIFPVWFRSADGIMHNKFIIADAADSLHAWVWTGSTNFSTNQLSTDPNHAYIIHDQALARSYQREFEEMWGTEANHSDARYGDVKTDNTVHQFLIGNTRIESYFSPSDETNCHLLEALRTANHHVEIGLLLLTKEDLIDEIISLHEEGIAVRVILEDEASSTTAVSRLRQADVPLGIYDFSPLFHHKYAIIDEGFPDSDPMVISGSHNWTWSADNINDENTIIFHDPSIANIFRQEYEARWEEIYPTSVSAISGQALNLWPNPASSSLQLSNLTSFDASGIIVDMIGHPLTSFQLSQNSQRTFQIPSDWANGIYFLQWTCNGHQEISKIIIAR